MWRRLQEEAKGKKRDNRSRREREANVGRVNKRKQIMKRGGDRRTGREGRGNERRQSEARGETALSRNIC